MAFFEGESGDQDALIREVNRLRQEGRDYMASSRNSNNSKDYRVSIRNDGKYITFSPPSGKTLRVSSPEGVFEEKVDIDRLEKHAMMPELLIVYTDGSIESFNDISYKIEVEDMVNA